MKTEAQKTQPAAGSIKQRLNQMATDAASIERALLDAPLDLTGDNEPKLFEIIRRIKGDLDKALHIWS